MSRFLKILLGVITIILFLFVYIFFWVYGSMELALLFVVFSIAVPVLLGCSVGVLLTKLTEKNTGKKPTYNIIMLYMGIPCCIFMIIAITLSMMLL